MGWTRVRRGAVGVALFVASLAWFSLAARCTLEWVDEGQIVYPIWRTAAGAVPYRDFGHAYWPSLLVLNALLLRLFGDDLGVLRAGLVVLKATIALIVYALARTVARPWIAPVAWGLLLAVWGAPFWVFNTPYANHYALALGLLAALVLQRSSWRGSLPAACAGLLTGAAATFKYTTGAFLALAGLVFLAAELRASPARRRLRGIVLGGAALLALAYVARPPNGWPTILVAAPVLAVLLRVALQRRGGVAGVGDVLAFGAGAAAPVLAYLLLAAWAGVLPAFLRETVTGIGAHLTWGMTLPPPPGNLLAALGALASCAVALAAWRGGRSGRAVAAGATAAGAAAWAWMAPGSLAIAAVHWLPVLVAGSRWRRGGRGRLTPSGRMRAAGRSVW